MRSHAYFLKLRLSFFLSIMGYPLLPLAGRIKTVLPHLAVNVEITEMLCPELQLPDTFRTYIHVSIWKVVRHM